MARTTAQLFDTMFKSIIHDASASAIVHLINGIYKKNYPLDMNVKIEPNEFIKEHPKTGKLERIVTDIIITLSSPKEKAKDVFLLEAQIDDDLDMTLRIFNYSTAIALRSRKVSKDNSYMKIKMPVPAVIYWETSKTKDIVEIEIEFPDNKTVVYEVPSFKILNHNVSELEGLALLLPFYILKIRKELKRTTNPGKRTQLAKKLEGYILEIDETIKKCKKNNYISNEDAEMLRGRMLKMNKELYGEYNEFKEVDMTLKQLLKVDAWEARKQGEKRGVSRTAAKLKSMGFSIAQIIEATGLSRREISAL